MKKRILALLLTFIMLFSVSAYASEENSVEFSVASSVLQYVDKNYHFGLDNAGLLRKMIRLYLDENPDGFENVMGVIMSSLDEYSEYYTAEEFKEFYAQVESEFAGIGAYLSRENGYITINSVTPDSPAAKASLTGGDRIVKVNGEDIVGVDSDYAVSKIRGEVGTKVVLTIERDGVGTFDVTITRDVIREETVTGAIYEKNIGYIYISNFSSSTGKEFENKILAYDDLGIKKLIIDLRYNGGGVTDQALHCLTYLLPKNSVMLKINSRTKGDSSYTNIDDSYKKRDVVVLVNEYTASAAEIFAAAIKDNQAGTLLGTKTFGKGTMQTTVGLGEYGGIKLTIAEFCGPNGTQIKDTGILPDIKVENKTRTVKEEDLIPMKFDKIYKKGEDNEQVLAIKQRLKVLKYFNGTMDNYYDQTLFNAVKTFQETNGLFGYGVADFTTQTTINNLISGAEITEDTQFDKALELLKK